MKLSYFIISAIAAAMIGHAPVSASEHVRNNSHISNSAVPTKSETSVYMLRPHEELPKDIRSGKGFKKIFLAGTIDMGHSKDWQKELYEEFKQISGKYILFNPRQEHWDAKRPGEMEYQVRWELEHLEEADMIIMYILGNSKSPISLLEMGLHARSKKMYVICEENFYRFDNVRITCDYYKLPLYTSLEDFIKDVLK